jgi:5-amino-6-(5-phosphoribosylamino)uracil reductase
VRRQGRRVAERPYVLLSVATSVDGYIDDCSDERLLLSDAAEMDRVDEVRASCDAILVGAGTIRRDNPRLLVRSAARREARLARGLTASPAKVTLTRTGELDPAASFFTAGDATRLVYAATEAADSARARLGSVATIIDAGHPVTLDAVLADLAARGIGRLMVEGGMTVHTGFLAAGAADELHLAIAPFFVGDPAAPRFVGGGTFPHGAGHPMELAEARPVGNVVLLRYLLSSLAS